MPVETKWQSKEIIMGEMECEIKMVNFSCKDKILKQSHIKACIETWRQRYKKRMNQGSYLDIGNLTFFSSHKKEKELKIHSK